MSGPVPIVIPAHNEAAVLRRCMATVLDGAQPDEFMVLVASNGSTDNTVALARDVGAELGHRVEVVEIDTASKIAALRAADVRLRETTDEPRIYLDADVLLPAEGARRLAGVLRTDEPRLALARIDIDTARSSWIVRQYYRAWESTGYINRQDAGSGVFAMNQAGADRVHPLPDVINDDGYVARCFSPDEKVVCDARFRSFAAHSAAALIRRRARIVNGNRQLDVLIPRRVAAPTATGGGVDVLAAVRKRELPLMSALVFIAVTVAARLLAAWRRLTGATATWSTDTTTRSTDTSARSTDTSTRSTDASTPSGS